MFQLPNEHRRHTVERRAFLLFDSRQGRTRIKALDRKYHGRTVCHATQSAQHATKTVVQRHRKANSVLLSKPLPIASIKSVEQNIAVREHCAFRISSRTGRILNVDWIAWTEPGRHFRQPLRRYAVGPCQQLIPRQHARRGTAPQRYDPLQFWKSVTLQLTWRIGRQLRTYLINHAEIVRRFICINEREPANLRLPQRVFQLARSI